MNKSEKIRFLIVNAVIMLLISSVSVYAAGNYFYTATDIGYDNSESGLEADNVQGALDDLREKATSYNKVREELEKIKQKIQPVGSIYMSTTDDTVAKVKAKFGGTWVKIEGRFLLASSSSYSVNATGGSADAVVVSHTHTLSGTATSAGAHTHSVSGTTGQGIGSIRVVYGAGSNFAPNHMTGWVNNGFSDTSTNWPGKAHTHNVSGTAASAGAHTHPLSGTATATGVSGTGKNMPPYYVVHVYKRTA